MTIGRIRKCGNCGRESYVRNDSPCPGCGRDYNEYPFLGKAAENIVYTGLNERNRQNIEQLWREGHIDDFTKAPYR